MDQTPTPLTPASYQAPRPTANPSRTRWMGGYGSYTATDDPVAE